MNEHLRRALEALELGATGARHISAQSTSQLRGHLQRTVEEVLEHLEADQRMADAEPEDLVARLDRQAQDIAEDLRRAERLMKQRTRQE